jgi:undecaprenyl-diphosphatase
MKKISFKKEEKIVLYALVVISIISFFLDGYAIIFMHLIRNTFFDYSLFVFSLTFSLFIPLLAATSIYLYIKNKKEGILPLWISFTLTFIIVYAVKFIVQRPRQLGEMFTALFHLSDYSFPSAHAALSFAILAVIDEKFKKLKIFWLSLAILIIFSRVYFQYHYFSDIVFGALLGYGIGMAVLALYKKTTLK